MSEHYIQGDIPFVRVGAINPEAIEDKSGIVAQGESTGHAHRIRPGSHATLLVFAGLMYIRALKETPIDHPQHGTIILPKGNWEGRRQREYIPEGWRQVAD